MIMYDPLQIEWTLADMEEDRDSDSDDEIEYSGMIQPPLIKQLRTILSEYPDDGQILKVRILHVNKQHNPTEKKLWKMLIVYIYRIVYCPILWCSDIK